MSEVTRRAGIPAVAGAPAVVHRTGSAPHSGVVVTRRERELAVAEWLLAAAPDAGEARAGWREHGAALLRCGGIFSAVRIEADPVHAAAGTDRPVDVDAHLRRALAGPVFADTHARTYYALVPAGAPQRWDTRGLPGVECLGSAVYLGVPAVDRTEPCSRLYWCSSMDSLGELCPVEAVVELAHAGIRCLAGEGGIR